MGRAGTKEERIEPSTTSLDGMGAGGILWIPRTRVVGPDPNRKRGKTPLAATIVSFKIGIGTEST